MTPDLYVGYSDQWELVQLSGYGWGADFSNSRSEPPPPAEPIYFYRDSLDIKLDSYQQESSFRCDPCYGDDNAYYAHDLYANLPVPDYVSLTVTGQYHRVYTQAELDALSALEIQPEYYDLILN